MINYCTRNEKMDRYLRWVSYVDNGLSYFLILRLDPTYPMTRAQNLGKSSVRNYQTGFGILLQLNSYVTDHYGLICKKINLSRHGKT